MRTGRGSGQGVTNFICVVLSSGGSAYFSTTRSGVMRTWLGNVVACGKTYMHHQPRSLHKAGRLLTDKRWSATLPCSNEQALKCLSLSGMRSCLKEQRPRRPLEFSTLPEASAMSKEACTYQLQPHAVLDGMHVASERTCVKQCCYSELPFMYQVKLEANCELHMSKLQTHMLVSHKLLHSIL